MKKGFTLIELLAVIVVLAILALVVTPIVLNIVENAQQGSDERSLEQYAKVMQTSFYEEKMKDTTLTLASFVSNVDTGSGVSLTYNGSRVVCSERKAVETASGEQTIELRNCTVDGRGPYEFINGKASKSDVYKNGEVVYFDVKEGKLCSNYHVDNSKTGYNGMNPAGNQTSCLKFYAFNDTNKSKNLNLLLDHNTTGTVYWTDSSTAKNENGPKDVINQLKTDTGSWKGTIEPSNYSLDLTDQTSNAKYTIDYSGYKARLITAQEIAQITENKNWNAPSPYHFQDLSPIPSKSSGTIKCTSSECKYGWLYDRTSDTCMEYGCLNNGDTIYSEYWTSTAYISNYAWYVSEYGTMNFSVLHASKGGTRPGVRPVITIPKS